MPVGNRQHDGLNRGQPQGPRTGEMLNQQRNEPLEAAEYCTMDYDRPVFGVVCADVFQVEPFRNLVVELNRGALPLPPDRVRDVEVDLGAVERTVALIDRVGLSDRVERLLEFRFGVIPLLDRTEILRRPR